MGREVRTNSTQTRADAVKRGDLVEFATDCAFVVTDIQPQRGAVTLIAIGRRWRFKPWDVVTVLTVDG